MTKKKTPKKAGISEEVKQFRECDRKERLTHRIEKLAKHGKSHRTNMSSRQSRLEHVIGRTDTGTKHLSGETIVSINVDNFPNDIVSLGLIVIRVSKANRHTLGARFSRYQGLRNKKTQRHIYTDTFARQPFCRSQTCRCQWTLHQDISVDIR